MQGLAAHLFDRWLVAKFLLNKAAQNAFLHQVRLPGCFKQNSGAEAAAASKSLGRTGSPEAWQNTVALHAVNITPRFEATAVTIANHTHLHLLQVAMEVHQDLNCGPGKARQALEESFGGV